MYFTMAVILTKFIPAYDLQELRFPINWRSFSAKQTINTFTVGNWDCSLVIKLDWALLILDQEDFHKDGLTILCVAMRTLSELLNQVLYEK